MAKLSSREQAAKKAGVAVDYSKSASQQGISTKYKANAQDVYSSGNLKTSMTGGVPKPNLNDPFGYAASLKQQYQLPKLEKASEKATKNINKFQEQTSKLIHNIEKQPLALPVMGRQEAVLSGQRSEQATALGNELSAINQRLGLAQQNYSQDVGFYQQQQSFQQQKQAQAVSQGREAQSLAMQKIKMITDAGGSISPELYKQAGIAPGSFDTGTQQGLPVNIPESPDVVASFGKPGTDTFVNPESYQQAKQQSGIDPQQFDATYGKYLSAEERNNLGIKLAPPTQSHDFYTSAVAPTPETANIKDPNINGTPAAVYQDALSFLYQGPTALSGMGMGQAKQVQNYRAAVKAKAAAIAQSLGVDEYQARALFKANSTAAGQQISRIAKIETTSSALQSQFPRLSQLAEQVKAEGINLTEADIQSGSAKALSKFGSPTAASYIELVQTVRGDYAAMQAGLAGSQGSQFLQENAQDAIPMGLTGKQYEAIQDTIEISSKKALAATQNEVQRLINPAVKQAAEIQDMTDEEAYKLYLQESNQNQ